MIQGHQSRKLEEKLKQIFDKIDDFLEDKYGGRFTLHPNRPPRGKTANKAHDGLFNVGATFSAGYGSKSGRGYVIEIDIRTLSQVPEQDRESIEKDVIQILEKELQENFPNRELKISKEGNYYKIHGDFHQKDLD